MSSVGDHRSDVRVPSEVVPGLRAIFAAGGRFAAAGDLLQLEVVLDASVVISDLLWMAKKRSNPAARTNLQELMCAETVIATAPDYLDEEVRSKLSVVSADQGVDVVKLESLWGEYRKSIRFEHVEVHYPQVGYRDPKDLPYIRLQQRTQRPIYTRDADFAGMGAAILTAEVFVTLRDYSRAASVEFAVKAGGLIVGGIGLVTVATIWRALASALAWFKKLPPGMQVLVGFGILALIVHPRTRAFVVEIINGLAPKALEAVSPLILAAAPYVESYSNASAQASALRLDVESAIQRGHGSVGGRQSRTGT